MTLDDVPRRELRAPRGTRATSRTRLSATNGFTGASFRQVRASGACLQTHRRRRACLVSFHRLDLELHAGASAGGRRHREARRRPQDGGAIHGGGTSCPQLTSSSCTCHASRRSWCPSRATRRTRTKGKAAWSRVKSSTSEVRTTPPRRAALAMTMRCSRLHGPWRGGRMRVAFPSAWTAERCGV